jgi:acyl carrier protein
MSAQLVDEIVEIVCSVGRLDELEAGEDFYDHGLSSMSSLQLMIELEARFDVLLDDDAFLSCRTAQSLADLIALQK